MCEGSKLFLMNLKTILRSVNMLKLISKAQAFMMDENGATAIEYGLIAAAVSVAIAAVLFTFGDNLVLLFGNLGTELETAANQVGADAAP